MYFISYFRFLLFLWCTFSITRQANADVYTAAVELEGLVKTEAMLIESYKNYVNEEEKKIEYLKRQIEHYEEEHEKAEKEAVEYLANPINIFLLLKRLTNDWKFEKYLPSSVYEEMITSIIGMGYRFPDLDDLKGTAAALARLQRIYGLTTESIANGELNGVKYSSELSSDDCFELGRQLYKKEYYDYAGLWMKEALRRYDPGNPDAKIFRWEILEYLAHLFYMDGDLQAAYNLTIELLAISPNNNPRAEISLHFYKLEQKKAEKLRRDTTNKDPEAKTEELVTNSTTDKDQHVKKKVEHPGNQRKEETPKYADAYSRYEMLCRNAVQLPAHITSHLKCRYVHKNNPYLLIAPFKEEEAYHEPKVFLYHEILYPNEIETMKKLAQPKLARSMVKNKNQNAITDVRTSKIAWLEEKLHPTIATIRQRVSDMTHLSMEFTELMQVCNYGVGGHYEPHRDYFGPSQNASIGSIGNRIATVLLYMTDVAQGGATVFPLLDVAVWPKQGMALFWYNLHSSGVPISSTLHGACPVLQGSKWASNLWIRERGQEFHRPCDREDESALIQESKTK